MSSIESLRLVVDEVANMTIPRYKRVPIDWDKLYDRIVRQGFTINSLADKIDKHPRVFYAAMQDHKMNPAIVHEIAKYVKFDVASVMPNDRIERIRNGRSTTGRLGTDWLYLEREAKLQGYSLRKLSLELGKSIGYLASCKREGGLYEEIMIQIGEILNIDYHNLIKVTSYGKWNLRHEIVDMVNNQEFPDLAKDTDISNMYQGASPYWCKLKEIMLGEVSNRLNQIGDYELAEKFRPNISSFTQEDVMKCVNIKHLPTDWKHFAFACMKKYGLPPFSEEESVNVHK